MAFDVVPENGRMNLPWLQHLLRRQPKRIFVVVGEQVQPFSEPPYNTRPDAYGFSFGMPWEAAGIQTESPTTFPPDPLQLPYGVEREIGPTVVKVFSSPDDAIRFTYHCNLATVIPQVYEKTEEGWARAKDQSAFDVDW